MNKLALLAVIAGAIWVQSSGAPSVKPDGTLFGSCSVDSEAAREIAKAVAELQKERCKFAHEQALEAKECAREFNRSSHSTEASLELAACVVELASEDARYQNEVTLEWNEIFAEHLCPPPMPGPPPTDCNGNSGGPK